MRLSIREWTYAEWLSSAAAWDALHRRSGLDPLFLSWDWLVLWWQHFGNKPSHRLCILAVYRNSELIGIAPLYRLVVGRRMLPVRSLQFIGISWRDDSALITEYLDFLCEPAFRSEVRSAIMTYLFQQDYWSELVISYTRDPSGFADLLHDASSPGSTYTRTIERCTSHQAVLAGGFPSYLANLGQSTRRSIWNLRRRLMNQGSVSIERLPPERIREGFSHLNRLHKIRWGRPAFANTRLRFHEALAARLSQRNELELCLLRIDDRVVSVLYDIRKGNRRYNIKMGFDPQEERGFSLGLLHLGFALEAASESGITIYDFLAGGGRRSDFKRHLAQHQEELATVQVLRGPVLRRIYRWYDRRNGSTLLQSTIATFRPLSGPERPAGT